MRSATTAQPWQDCATRQIIASQIVTNMKFLFFLLLITATSFAQDAVKWKNALHQKAEWYSSDEALRIAENVLLYQRNNGGWTKNVDMAKPLEPAERAQILEDKDAAYSTIDNGATYTQLQFLAKVFNASKQGKYKSACLNGLDYLLTAQYANGGWPQYFPLRKGYYTHITYNDDAMIGVMRLLREIAKKNLDYNFVDEARRLKSAQAVEKGIEIILKTQVVVDGKKTVWCAQHDEVTLAPAPARAYEKISLSGAESVGIVRFLMEVKNPTPSIIEAIKSAVAWFEQTKINGLKIVDKADPTLPKGYDKVVVEDVKASPLWARFYDLKTNRPIFCGRDGIIKFSLAEIEHERRTGYRWYVNNPSELLNHDYPAWQARL